MRPTPFKRPTETPLTMSPTKERLSHATDQAVFGKDKKVLVAANENFSIDKETRAYLLSDTPIGRLEKSGKITGSQSTAAARFYADYYNAGLAPLGAQDYGRPIVDGTPVSSGGDFRTGASERYNKACKKLSNHFLVIVDAIILRELSPEMAGRSLNFKNAPQARAVAIDRLCGGLDILACHYGIG